MNASLDSWNGYLPIVVVRGHTKATIRPSNQLHGSGIRNQVLQVAPASFEQSFGFKLFLVVLVKDGFHGCPESFLPLEDGLFGDNIRSNLSVQTTLEEQVCQMLDIIIRILYKKKQRKMCLSDNKGEYNGVYCGCDRLGNVYSTTRT